MSLLYLLFLQSFLSADLDSSLPTDTGVLSDSAMERERYTFMYLLYLLHQWRWNSSEANNWSWTFPID